MAIIENFIVPTIKTLFLVGLSSFLLFVVVRYFWISYTRRWKWSIRYTLLRNKYSEKDLAWILDAFDKGMDDYKIKGTLLLHGLTANRVYEMMWIVKKVEKQLKGGNQNGRQFKRSNSKTQSTELPDNTKN